MADPARYWKKGYRSFEVVQCEVPLLKIIKLEGLSQIASLALVGLQMRQSHLKVILGMESKVRILDLSMNRELGDYGFLMILQSKWVEGLMELHLGGPELGCGLTKKSIELLVDHADKLKGLSMLDLSWNRFYQEGYRYLARSFERVSAIYRIDLTRTGVDSAEPSLPNVLV